MIKDKRGNLRQQGVIKFPETRKKDNKKIVAGIIKFLKNKER